MTRSTDPDNATDCTLVLFTKRPAPGVGKQRVAEVLGRDVAFALAGLLFDCAAEDLACWPGPTALCIADADDVDWAVARCPRTPVIAQASGNLGARLQAATAALAPAGGPLLFVGSDAPTLDLEYLLDAATALRDDDVALGAAADGGVVTMGCRRGWPELSGLPWSTPQLGSALAAACRTSGRGVTWLPRRADVDTAAALRPVAQALRGDTRPARRALREFIERSISRARDIA